MTLYSAGCPSLQLFCGLDKELVGLVQKFLRQPVHCRSLGHFHQRVERIARPLVHIFFGGGFSKNVNGRDGGLHLLDLVQVLVCQALLRGKVGFMIFRELS